MLSFTTVEVAPARARFRMGALLPWDAATAFPCDRGMESAAGPSAAAGPAVASMRPQARSMTVLFGTSAHVAEQANFDLQQPTTDKHAYPTTRIAAAGGGALGSHPARDPV